MKKLITIFIVVVMFYGCEVDHSEEGTIYDFPFFLFTGDKSTESTSAKTTKDKFLAVVDGDTLEFEGRTLELYQVKAPELNDQSVMKSQAAQCTEADSDVIKAMALEAKQYIADRLKVGSTYNLNLKTQKDRDQVQIGYLYIKEGNKINTLGWDLIRNGYGVPYSYKSNSFLDDVDYQLATKSFMIEAMMNNRGLWRDYPSEMNCLAEIGQH
jgi:endonuclease YncB( thermonuclease family)